MHDAITTLAGSQQKTLANIKKVLALGLLLRVGMIRIHEEQDIEQTKQFLIDVGVDPARIGVDRTRGVGRGSQIIPEDPVSSLCGQCVKSRCVVTATGEVYPCIMARSFLYGEVHQQTLQEILHSRKYAIVKQELGAAFNQRLTAQRDCDPECDPAQYPPCDPDCCPETVASCEPKEPDDGGGDDDD